jgi:hypothetical protein
MPLDSVISSARSRDQVLAVRRMGDGGDLQRFEIRRIVDALTP